LGHLAVVHALLIRALVTQPLLARLVGRERGRCGAFKAGRDDGTEHHAGEQGSKENESHEKSPLLEPPR
jgi:hypothetical protein